MDAQQFLAEFSHIASAPNGIQRLREMIFSLAATGDLVSSDNSADAHPLLYSIREQKAVHPDQKKVVLPQRKLLPHEVHAPEHWAPCRLGDLVLTITGGGTPSKSNPVYWDGDIPWASVKDLKDNKFLEQTEDYITSEGLANSSTNLIPPGRVIVSTRMGLGKLVINRIAVAINQDLKALELPNEVNIDFFYILYRTKVIKGTGTTVAGIRQEKLLDIPAALPPVEEQKRIVAKVDELMFLCDKLEAQQQEREGLCKLTRMVVLETLNSANTTLHLGEAWARLAGNMKLLLDSPESVEDFRSTIMRLAVWGLLTKRTEADSRVLLEQCLRHKESLVREGRIKRGKPQKQIEDQPTLLPENWTWVRFSEIGIFARGKSKNRPRNDPRLFAGGQYPFIQTGDVANSVGKGISTFSKSYNEAGLKQSQLWPKGTLCITIAANIAESAILKIDACFPDSVVGFLPFAIVGNVEYFDLFVRTSKLELAKFAPSTAQKNINLGILEQVAVPLPPREEMEDIVNTTSKLLLLCDHIEQELTKSQDVGKLLAVSAVSAITGINIEDKEKMKAPKTELVSNLRIGVSPASREQAPLAAILVRHQGELPARALWGSSGLEIDAFYQQLKTEMANGWIVQPEAAYMKELETA